MAATKNMSGEEMHVSGHNMIRLIVFLVGLLISIGSAYFLWSGKTLVTLMTTISAVVERMDTYNNEVQSLRGDFKRFAELQYTKVNAESDKRLIYREIEIINKRIDKLENE